MAVITAAATARGMLRTEASSDIPTVLFCRIFLCEVDREGEGVRSCCVCNCLCVCVGREDVFCDHFFLLLPLVDKSVGI